MVTGLLLVDIQNEYFEEGKVVLSGMEQASSKAKVLLNIFRRKNWPIFHIQQLSDYEGATYFLPHTEGVEFNRSVKPLHGETIIQKQFANSFRATSLRNHLEESNVEQVVICGAMSHMCIDSTTRAAFDLGYQCFVVHDACATRALEFGGTTYSAKEVHGSFMAALGSAYAKVLSCDGIVSSFTEDDRK